MLIAEAAVACSAPILLLGIGGTAWTAGTGAGKKVANKVLNGASAGVGIAMSKASKATDKGFDKANNIVDNVLLDTPKENYMLQFSSECRKPIVTYVGCMSKCIAKTLGTRTQVSEVFISAVITPVCFLGKCKTFSVVPCLPEISKVGANNIQGLIKKSITNSITLAKGLKDGAYEGARLVKTSGDMTVNLVVIIAGIIVYISDVVAYIIG